MRIFLLAFFTLAFSLVRPATADVYNVTIDTSSLGGSGILDFVFGNGAPPSALSTVTIYDFVTSGSVAAGTPSGGVNGGLSTSLNVSNEAVYNDYYAPIVFGNSLSFKLSFSAEAVNASNINTFAFSILNDVQTTGLLTSNADGFAFTLDAGGNKTSLTNFMSNGTGSIVMAAVPEPEEYAMMLVGFGLVGFQVKRKKSASR